ncbi:Uncharacterised protein [Klebsiella pneumoniae]|nr:Uncharacterised protein [Klebsiella pneumoniae]
MAVRIDHTGGDNRPLCINHLRISVVIKCLYISTDCTDPVAFDQYRAVDNIAGGIIHCDDCAAANDFFIVFHASLSD